MQAAVGDSGALLSSDPRLADFFNMPTAHSGAIVTHHTARQVSAAYACTRLISGAVAALPLRVYERGDGFRKPVDHDIWWLLNEQPFPTLSASTWMEWIVDSMLMRGDALCEIKRRRDFSPSGFMPIPYEAWVVDRVKDGLQYYISAYATNDRSDASKAYGLLQDDVIHVPGFGFNGLRGESVIRYAARQAIGAALAADEFSGRFFAQGLNVGAVIKYPQGVSPDVEQQQALRNQFEERYQGNSNAHKPLLLVNGGELQRVAMSASDAQLLEARQFQVVDIARAFGVPPHMIGETSASTSWGSGIEQMSIGFMRYTLGPHLRRIEQELNRKLWPRSTKYFVEFDREAMTLGDNKSESDFIRSALGGPGQQGYMSVNEYRHRRNMPPIAGMDAVFVAGKAAGPSEPTPPEETT